MDLRERAGRILETSKGDILSARNELKESIEEAERLRRLEMFKVVTRRSFSGRGILDIFDVLVEQNKGWCLDYEPDTVVLVTKQGFFDERDGEVFRRYGVSVCIKPKGLFSKDLVINGSYIVGKDGNLDELIAVALASNEYL